MRSARPAEDESANSSALWVSLWDGAAPDPSGPARESAAVQGPEEEDAALQAQRAVFPVVVVEAPAAQVVAVAGQDCLDPLLRAYRMRYQGSP